jgi:hypothetical protein
MATYYKYAERSADSQVNWAEVGKGISDMLADEVKIREEKKAAIDKSTREFQQTLQNAPQGQFQDANKFTNDYAHSMMEQQMIDTKLLKSGKMKLQDYTLRRQNYIDGTNTLFDLQKLYQENYRQKMEGVQTGEFQPLTGANMASVEGFGDFSKSKAVIDPATGVVNVGILEPDPNNQGVMRLTNDVVPVNVIRGKILTNIPAFKVEEAMNSTVKTLGNRIKVLQEIATQTKAGSITKLTGGAIDSAKYPQFKDDVDKFNKAVDETVKSYFADPYHLSSVLTMQLDKYDGTSFTYDKELAKKDPSKLLLKINPSTGLGILDESGAHYKAQEKEAQDWVKTQLLAKMDNKVEVDLGGFAPQPRQPSQYEYARADARKTASVLGENISNLMTGNPAQTQAALDYFQAIPNVEKVEKNKDVITVTTRGKDGESVTQSLKLNETNARNTGQALAKLLNTDKLPEDMVSDYVNKFNSNKRVNLVDSYKGGKTVEFFDAPIKKDGVGSKY